MYVCMYVCIYYIDLLCEIQQKLAKISRIYCSFFFNYKFYPISLSKNGEILPGKRKRKKQ
jgi:hypothetical protein